MGFEMDLRERRFTLAVRSRLTSAPLRCECAPPNTIRADRLALPPEWRRSTRAGWIRLRVELRSEEHTSELQSQSNLVCRLLLEKKKQNAYTSVLHQTAG